MRKLNIIIFLISGIGLGNTSENYMGKKCSANYQCKRTSFSVSRAGKIGLLCSDGFCKCKPGREVEYSFSMEPSCSVSFDLNIMDVGCSATSCKDNEECVDLKDKGVTSWGARALCYCKEGFLRVYEDCVEVTYVGASEECGRFDGQYKGCKLEEYSKCVNGTCTCFEDYIVNPTSKKCQSMQDYLKASNLSGGLQNTVATSVICLTCLVILQLRGHTL